MILKRSPMPGVSAGGRAEGGAEVLPLRPEEDSTLCPETWGFTSTETIKAYGEVGLYLTSTRYTVTTRINLYKGGQLCEPC